MKHQTSLQATKLHFSHDNVLMNILGAPSFLLPSCYPMPCPSVLWSCRWALRAEALGGGSRKQAQFHSYSKYSLPSWPRKANCFFTGCGKIHSALILAVKIFNYEAGILRNMWTRHIFVICVLLAVPILPDEQQKKLALSHRSSRICCRTL